MRCRIIFHGKFVRGDSQRFTNYENAIAPRIKVRERQYFSTNHSLDILNMEKRTENGWLRHKHNDNQVS